MWPLAVSTGRSGGISLQANEIPRYIETGLARFVRRMNERASMILGCLENQLTI